MPRTKVSPEVLEKIKNLVGPEHYLDSYEDRICYSYDSTIEESIPDAICFPADAPQIAQIVKWANEALLPVIPRGSGTGLSGGSVPCAADWSWSSPGSTGYWRLTSRIIMRWSSPASLRKNSMTKWRVEG